jgi:glucose/arabinose dehydrogenase
VARIDLPYSNHNGGQIVFSPADGYLYVPTGDGGGSNDDGFGHTPGLGNAQDLTKMLGKVLRIDVDNVSGEREYAIPADNPFAGDASVPPELFAYGLRNPAYLAFDSGGDHLLYTAVAGQQLFESVYIVVKGGNYGWNIREGTHCFSSGSSSGPPASVCPITGRNGDPIIGPIVEGGHDLGNTIVGGCIYRGDAFPALVGRYVFGYWSTSFRAPDGVLLVASPPASWNSSLVQKTAADLTPAANDMWNLQVLTIAGNPSGRPGVYVRGIGEDDRHELYVATSRTSGPVPEGTSGQIWRIVPA